MKNVIIIGTDTDAGKTTLSLLVLSRDPDRFRYWKPVETGTSDSETIRRLVLTSRVIPSLGQFQDPVAPPLAARLAGLPMPTIDDVCAAVPKDDSRPILLETFGGPFSPFTESNLQLELLQRLRWPLWLVTSSTVGAIGRSLQTVNALAAAGCEVTAIVLVGEQDSFAVEQLEFHLPKVPVFSLPMIDDWNATSIIDTALSVASTIDRLCETLAKVSELPADLVRRDRAAVWHPYTSLCDPIDPLPVVRAYAEYLELADGRRLIDGISSWWTILHGHAQPELVRALQAAAGSLDHVLFAGITHPPAVEFAEWLLRTAPWKGGRVFYSDNGSTAVEVALKMAYQYWCHRGEPQRTLFVGLENCYHGDTFGTMAISRDPVYFGRFEPLLFETARVRCSADALDEFLAKNAGRVAAVIVEPLVQAACGMRFYAAEELAGFFIVCRRYGVLLIVDEVMSACRTGSFWAFDQAGIRPDLICAGKTLTGGILPLAATLASPEIVAEFMTPDRTRTLFHGHSFTANPLACAVAVANSRLVSSIDWAAESARFQAILQEHLEPLREHPAVMDVRYCGTIAAIELHSTDGYLAAIGPRLREFCVSNGVLLRPLGNVLYTMPPRCTSAESLHRIGATMAAAVRELTTH